MTVFPNQFKSGTPYLLVGSDTVWVTKTHLANIAWQARGRDDT